MARTREKRHSARINGTEPFSVVPLGKQAEQPPVRQSKTLGYWIVMIFPVGFVWAVAPMLIGFSLLHLARYHQFSAISGSHWFYKTVLWMGWVELPFQIRLRWLSHNAQARKSYPVHDEEFLRNILVQCLSAGIPLKYDGPIRPKQEDEPDWSEVPEEGLEEIRKRFRVWFHLAPISAIRADNARDWVAWAVAGGRYLHEAQQDPKSNDLVEAGLDMLSKRLRWRFPEGRNPDVKVMRLTLDPVKITMRPFGYYVVCNGMAVVAYAWLVGMHGFHFETRHGLQLLVKPPSPGKSPINAPIVFLHALGVGIAHNFVFFKRVANSTNGIIMLLQPNISTHIWHPRFLDPPSKEDHVLAIQETCAKYGIKKATILSQSNGTMVHAWLLRGAPELCERNILVDAVCFKLWEGDLCWAFSHKRRHTALHLILSYFVLRELGIAHTISRDFQWVDMLLWIHELPSVAPDRLRIVLGENDSLIDTPSIVEHLREFGVPPESIYVMKGVEHGISLIRSGKGMDAVLEALTSQ